MASHANAGKDQKRTEDIDNPMELLEQGCADSDQRAAHHQCSENSPKKHAMLIRGWHSKEREDQNKNKDVVYAERLLDQIAC